MAIWVSLKKNKQQDKQKSNEHDSKKKKHRIGMIRALRGFTRAKPLKVRM